MGAALKLEEEPEFDLDAVELDSTTDEDVERAAEALEDFPTFCSLVEIKPKEGGLIAFHYEDWHVEQQMFEAARTGWDIILKPRQVGFSTLELARDLHFAITRVGVNVVVVVHEKKAAEDLFLVVKTMLDSLRKIGLAPRTKYDSVRQIVFADLNSTIRVIEAGATEHSARMKGRSGTIHRLHLTELAYWGAAQTTMTALLGCVPLTGEVVIESTPNGASGTFYDLVDDAAQHPDRKPGPNAFRLHFYPFYLHAEYRLPANDGELFDPKPRDRWEELLRKKGCNDDQIRWWRSNVDNPAIGLERALAEWPIDPQSCFRTGGGHYVSAEAIDVLTTKLAPAPKRIESPLRVKMPDGSTRAFDVELRIYADRIEHRRYILAGDPSEGTGGDGSSGTLLDAETGETCATLWSDSVEAGDFGLCLAEVGHRFNDALIACERNNHGHAVLRAIAVEAKYPAHRIYVAADGKRGWCTNAQTRPVLFDDLRMAIEEGSAWTPDAATLGETRTIVKDPSDGRPRAKNKGQPGGARDDRFVSWAIGWQVWSKPGPLDRMRNAMRKAWTQ